MAHQVLSRRDIQVLEKIRDPESNPSTSISIEPNLPSDPNVPDQGSYVQISQQEREIVFAMQQLELRLAGLRLEPGLDPIEEYRECIRALDKLIAKYPSYASARNNRAQALRRLYGDSLLVADANPLPQALRKDPDNSERMQVAETILSDLDCTVQLLSTKSQGGLSQQAAKTLSMAYTQRAAVYHMTSKLLSSGSLAVDSRRREANWDIVEFEEAASRDFAMGGRYGNEIAKGLAVSTNPTAKLCGQIVREAMKKEYGPEFAA